ncbi:hypothetical protein BU25DRAFT_492170 [Macroventuria anomochaeta]|uniref:Uncharacterized protein n=1 Tax=Macroventuria anomochaeta TaxID=301207 RepID=A0ACB6RXA5_9PLEO|nr:uncharacterized protein BU25DRAFT_492170 [Macroventuria anomochaeta]KAF2626419.1 hypothetical protein BU25DRAFT_492170 [Macroventuria anomochaeta]
MALPSIVKYPFSKLYRFGKLMLDAKSTKWPGMSRAGIYMLNAALLLSIAQISLHLWLAVTLANLPAEAQGCYEGNGLTGFPMTNEKTYRPVTYANIRGKEALSIGANPSTATFVFATVLPFIVFILLCMTVGLHFSRRGMSNRYGVLLGCVLFLGYLGTTGASAFLNIDTDDVRTDYEWCWVDHVQMVPLAAARETRFGVRTAISALMGVEVACATLYIFASFYAARTNAKSTRAMGRRLQDLSPDGIRIDVNAPPRPPHDDEENIAVSDMPAQDPFDDTNAVTTSNGKSIDSIDTYTPSGHPFTDPEHRSSPHVNSKGQEFNGPVTSRRGDLEFATEGGSIRHSPLSPQDIVDDRSTEDLRTGGVGNLSVIEEEGTIGGSASDKETGEAVSPFEDDAQVEDARRQSVPLNLAPGWSE